MWGSGWGIRVSPNGLGQDVCCLADVALGHLTALVNVLLQGQASFLSACFPKPSASGCNPMWMNFHVGTAVWGSEWVDVKCPCRGSREDQQMRNSGRSPGGIEEEAKSKHEHPCSLLPGFCDVSVSALCTSCCPS